jgi:hypothetical protein
MLSAMPQEVSALYDPDNPVECPEGMYCIQDAGPGEELETIGGQKDTHGCLTSAGYSWNETEQACKREWSGEVQQPQTGNIEPAPYNEDAGLGSAAPGENQETITISPESQEARLYQNPFRMVFMAFKALFGWMVPA